ncbi:MAG: cyclase family protein [Saprospiraceae bacterium]
MKIDIHWNNQIWTADLRQGMDISIPLKRGKMTPNCFFAPFYEAKPFKSGDFIGSIEQGSPVNFYNVIINPHGNGTHTECVSHIVNETVSIHDCLHEFHFFGEIISVFPQLFPNGDRIITKESLLLLGKEYKTDVLILRTLPNDDGKLDRSYSGTNPPYLNKEAVALIVDWGVRHLILDLPSVDREEDGGRLEGHKTFWSKEDGWDKTKTITEMVYVPNVILDGLYFVQFSIISVDIDASPSKIILYPVQQK